ncbi:DNA polymerase III subunit gamma/tau [Bacillus atrophaeus]|uniref:DNA polymerase III subunit gamma/tau n=1 Tax=Bacillus atrophaeus TaxID=1452 RepID=UPI0022821901|nr:DNA polymerase III subunit gamma/tau [Bacillus atrophaeus]MCY8521141.1 DNA polymerase III subunit gamma/tau [Bacillus atrophaeus]MCY8526700.1 DNA polymerase III subunit gamma/tau [Bacillus atrophaeus]
MSYQALYRVFRPQRFEDVVGQEHITKTLQNALLKKKFSHAYLFSGPRGTGKTSAAKIFSKAVNCEHAPVEEPCNNCAACKGITNGSISDVIEIDAASNNGVDEIRDIRDKVKFAPSAVTYKVYIIDEVHMLSIGAFNALLKTLEEPPEHCIFILATTEPHKIPLTIISRCQRFDFKRITPQAIVGRMKKIVEAEQLKVEEGALDIIASAADGGMRDALSLLDQAVSFSGDELTVDDALLITGAVSQHYIGKLAQSLHEKQVSGALETLNELLQQGKDAAKLIEDMIFYFRDMLLYKTAPGLEGVLEKVKVDDTFRALSEQIPASVLYEMIDVLNKSHQEMKWTNHPRIFFEVAVVKICQSTHQETAVQPEVDILMKKVQQLEQEIERLKTTGVQAAPDSRPQKETPRPQKSGKSSYKAPTGRIHEILKEATRQDLDQLKSSWGKLLAHLKQQNKVSHAALLNDSEPVAAASKAFVLKFKYEIHCKMVAEDNNGVRTNLEQILESMLGKRVDLIGVPEAQWGKIREEFLVDHQQENEGSNDPAEEDPLIAEAKKLVGAELIEIKE